MWYSIKSQGWEIKHTKMAIEKNVLLLLLRNEFGNIAILIKEYVLKDLFDDHMVSKRPYWSEQYDRIIFSWQNYLPGG